MRIVAIETSGRRGSVAALSDQADEPLLLRQIELDEVQRTAQALAPAVRQLLADVSWQPRAVELVAVAVGPGSFTGLRIGVTTAKAFAYASGSELIGVNTLAALAAQAAPRTSPLWTIMDAQRQELFVARFVASTSNQVVLDCEPAIVQQESWLTQLSAGDAVTGPALRRLLPRLPDGVVAVGEEHWQPMASAVGRLGWHAHAAGRRDDLWQLVPQYYRLSAAEEKLP